MPQKYDPITLEILWRRLISIVDEADAAVARTAFASLLRDAHGMASRPSGPILESGSSMKTNNPLRPKTYPDISHILVAKAQRRLALAALSWEEKVAIIEQMRRQSPKNMWGPKSGPAPAQSRSQQGTRQKA